jgi:hypothetical protein
MRYLKYIICCCIEIQTNCNASCVKSEVFPFYEIIKQKDWNHSYTFTVFEKPLTLRAWTLLYKILISWNECLFILWWFNFIFYTKFDWWIWPWQHSSYRMKYSHGLYLYMTSKGQRHDTFECNVSLYCYVNIDLQYINVTEINYQIMSKTIY